MSFYVYYHDGHSDDGAEGFEKFKTKQEVAEFIKDRMAHAEHPTVEAYTVIEGNELEVTAVEVATRIDVGFAKR